jgi:gas vesicle protein
MALVAIPQWKGAFFMSALKVWVVFSIGVAAGAAVALLYAPQTGIKTRRQIRRGLEDAGDYVRDTADTISGHAERYVKRGRDIMENVADTASTAYGAARKVVPI